MKTLPILMFFLLFLSYSFSQVISNIFFEPIQNKVLIYYDLEGDPEKEYEVSLTLKREEYSGFQFIPESVSGDIGEGKFVGKKRKIIWEVNKDYHIDPEATDYYFEVEVNPISTGIGWFYYAGAAVLSGGVAAVLLLGKKGIEENKPIGAPPARP